MTEAAASKKPRRAASAASAPEAATEAQASTATPEGTDASSATFARAEQAVDRFLHQASTFGKTASRTALRLAALLREEAEDILAEAHDLRRQHGSGPASK